VNAGVISLGAAARNVVERARLNDQNAIALIAHIRQLAESGAGDARKGLDAILAYAHKNPMKVVASPIGAAGINAINILRRPELSSRDHVAALSILPIVCPHDGVTIGSVTLMQGPPLDDGRIGWLADGFTNDELKGLFIHGVTNGHSDPTILQSSPDVLPTLLAGKCVGAARAMQVAASPNTPLAPYSPVIGWELGEFT
jgi:hypothetical protein